MKKLFISQPMKGKTDDEILAEREKAIKSAERQLGEPVEVIDSFFQSAPADAKPLEYHAKYTKFGNIPSYAYQNFCEMYDAYHALGGNGMVTKMKQEIDELHIKQKGE